jgi:hypothetical protein
VLRRHVHSLEELCRKAILVYTGHLPDKKNGDGDIKEIKEYMAYLYTKIY